jgi:hypothetical protein
MLAAVCMLFSWIKVAAGVLLIFLPKARFAVGLRCM